MPTRRSFSDTFKPTAALEAQHADRAKQEVELFP